MLPMLGRQAVAPFLGTRAFATGAKDLVTSENNPFLRFSNPFPTIINHQPLLATLPETKITTLPNGLRVASEAIPFAETSTVGIWISAGSRYESESTNGTAHFLEHLLFKGTKTKSMKDLELEVEGMGGKFSAHTGREQTSYYAKVMGKDVGKAVAILSDIMLNSNLDEANIEAERQVILRQMEDINKSQSELVFDHLHATAFQYSPLGRTILGPVDNVKSIQRSNLVDYMATHYRGPRIVLAAAGDVDHDELVKLASASLGSIPDEDAASSVRSRIITEPSKFTGSYVHDRMPDAAQCSFAVAFKGASWTDPDSIPLMIMQQMLGGWDRNSTIGRHSSSSLTMTVATEHLGNSFQAFNHNYHDTGLFGVYGVTDRQRCEDMAYAITAQITRMCYDVSETDVARARNQLKASHMVCQDSTHQVAEAIGRDLLAYGRRLPKAELFARIDAVDANTIRAVADRFIYDQDIAVASAGDVQFMPDYNWFRRRTYWLRY